jgi:hypothetical protein
VRTCCKRGHKQQNVDCDVACRPSHGFVPYAQERTAKVAKGNATADDPAEDATHQSDVTTHAGNVPHEKQLPYLTIPRCDE